MIIIAEQPAEYLFDVVPVTVPRIAPEHNPIGNDGSFEELCFLTAARERGYVTWIPVGHSQKADVAIWQRPHRPITVQVKRGQFHKGSWRCPVGSTRGGREKKMRRANNKPLDELRKYEVGDFDVLALYVPPANAFRFWSLHVVAGQRQVSLSDLSTLNNWHVIEDALKA